VVHKNGPSAAGALIRISHEDVFVSELADSIENEERRSDVPQGVVQMQDTVCGKTLFVREMS
jgi:hypothetical protein